MQKLKNNEARPKFTGSFKGGGGCNKKVCRAERCGRLSRFYKTLYGGKYRVRKIVVNWCKRHK